MQELNSSDQTICLHQIQIGHGSDIRVLELENEEAWVGIPVWSSDQHISPIISLHLVPLPTTGTDRLTLAKGN